MWTAMGLARPGVVFNDGGRSRRQVRGGTARRPNPKFLPRFYGAWALALLASTLLLAAKEQAAGAVVFTVAQNGRGDFNGTDQKPFQAAVDAAVKAGGGTILVRPGTYVFNAPVRFVAARGITIRGHGR
ncbi:MAG: hypothetical protein QHJ73_06145, partial [Armatimonadota bacterium]|nr:hypothetical protein [Armatimonadota bacterium]